MSRILKQFLPVVIIAFFMSTLTVEAQGRYENDDLCFEYGPDFELSTDPLEDSTLFSIVRADENDYTEFAILRFRSDVFSKVSIWDDNFLELMKQKMNEEGTCVIAEKRLVNLKHGKEKSIFVLQNFVVDYVNVKMATCIFIYQNRLYKVCYGSLGQYQPSSSCDEFFQLLKGLAFKEYTPQTGTTSNQQFYDRLANAEGYWDAQNKIYANYFYGFSWDLSSSDWNKEIGTELHTVFKARNTQLPVLVFVQVREYNSRLANTDIYDQFDLIYQQRRAVYDSLQKRFGVDSEILTFERTKLCSKNALKSTYILRQKSTATNDAESTYAITYLTILNGRLFSVNLNMSLEFYEFFKDRGIDSEYIERMLLTGFKFTAN